MGIHFNFNMLQYYEWLVLFLEHCHKMMMKPTHVHIHKYADKDDRIRTKISSNLEADAYVWK